MSLRINNGFRITEGNVFDVSDHFATMIRKAIQRNIVQLYVNNAYHGYDLLTANDGLYADVYTREHGELSPLMSAASATDLWVKIIFEETTKELFFFQDHLTKHLLMYAPIPNQYVDIIANSDITEDFEFFGEDENESDEYNARGAVWERSLDLDRPVGSQGLSVSVITKSETSIFLLGTKEYLKEIGFKKPSPETRIKELARLVTNNGPAQRQKDFAAKNIHLVDTSVNFAEIIRYSRNY